MVQLRGKNSKLVQQNKKLAVEIPKQLMAQVSKMEEQLHDAKVTRDKQIRVLFRRVERRDLEIFHLRSVWRALLTSHPDIDRAGEAMIAEIKAMEHEKEKLELELADEQEQKEALIITVADSYLKLVLANWRRPTYLCATCSLTPTGTRTNTSGSRIPPCTAQKACQAWSKPSMVPS